MMMQTVHMCKHPRSKSTQQHVCCSLNNEVSFTCQTTSISRVESSISCSLVNHKPLAAEVHNGLFIQAKKYYGLGLQGSTQPCPHCRSIYPRLSTLTNRLMNSAADFVYLRLSLTLMDGQCSCFQLRRQTSGTCLFWTYFVG